MQMSSLCVHVNISVTHIIVSILLSRGQRYVDYYTWGPWHSLQNEAESGPVENDATGWAILGDFHI